MKNNKTQQSVWSNLPDKLIKLSTSLKEYIESDSYLYDDNHMQFQLTSMEIKALKNELHEGVAYSKFIECEDNRLILSQYLQYQLNSIDNLKKELNVFLNKNSLGQYGYNNKQYQQQQNNENFYTPTSPNISPPQQSMILSNPSSPFQFDSRVNQKRSFIDSIRFFLSKLQYQKESYLELYGQKENVNNYLSLTLMKHKLKLPTTTYSLERLCEIVRTSLQEVRSSILQVEVDEINANQLEFLNEFKKTYNKIKTLPLVQYIAKLFKVIKELKTATFQFSKAINAFEKHLSDKKNLQNVQQLINHIEQESDVRYRMRKQSDPTQELTPGKKQNNNNGINTGYKTLSKCNNENIDNSPNFELSNQQTDDQSSIRDDTSSLFQSVISNTFHDHRRNHQNQQQQQQQNQSQQQFDKENTSAHHNRIHYDDNKKCHSSILLKCSTSNNNKSSTNTDVNQPLRKTVSNIQSQQQQQQQQQLSDKNQKEFNLNNTNNNNKIENNNQNENKKHKNENKTKKQSSDDNTEILNNSQQSQSRKESIANEISYLRKKKEFTEIKESVVSNAQSSFLDTNDINERQYELVITKKSDDKCISACNIF